MKKEQRFETTDWNPLNVEKVVEKIVKEKPDETKADYTHHDVRRDNKCFVVPP